MIKIQWIDLKNGTPFTTNGVPFENIVLWERISRSDKTWKRWSGWSEYFHCRSGALEKVRVVHRDDPDFQLLAQELDKCLWHDLSHCEYFIAIKEASWWLFGHCVARKLTWLYKEKDGAIEESGWMGQIGPYFKIFCDDGTIFERRKPVQPHWGQRVEILPYEADWRVLHELSGQAMRRKIRIAINSLGGSLATYALAQLGAGIPTLAPSSGELLPLVEWDFIPSKRGDGWAVTGLGKVLISRTCQAGYYKIIKETEKVRFIELVEPFRVIEP